MNQKQNENKIPADIPMDNLARDPKIGGIADYIEEKKKDMIVVDSFSLLPNQCWEIYEKSKKGEHKIVVLQANKEIMERKLKAVQMGFEFLPEYYDFAEKMKISLDEFRNFGIIQKDFGFKDQRTDEPVNYIKADNGGWIYS